MTRSPYYYKRPGRQPILELVATAVVVIAVVVALAVFLVVYHDFPLRIP